ncbi:hypothetical protein [Vibrio quintilis]|uniref:Uncharacterized protein n=1 Tax=Vibrio quintilis TaxID=1117707 RepID=A0A1M7Z0N7_9VIBR|nr:hypothetical protein [Vibrio quintilis]SHO58498.1 hypothetical protein VQ7734_04270 [Vibrio quintilis]
MVGIPQVVDEKIKWLSGQVDVEFPTEPSLKGRSIYLASIKQCRYSEIVPDPASDAYTDEALTNTYLVDFHRLTVMFALLQANQYDGQAEKDAIVEFFTQIILSPPCQLYLGFEAGQAVAAAIITRNDSELLISDIVILPNQLYPSADDFSRVLMKKVDVSPSGSIRCFIESGE